MSTKLHFETADFILLTYKPGLEHANRSFENVEKNYVLHCTYALTLCFMEVLRIFFLTIFLMTIPPFPMHTLPFTDTPMWLIWHFTPIFDELAVFCFNLSYSKPI